MTRLIVLAIVCLIGWKGYTHFEEKQQASVAATSEKAWSPTPSVRSATVSASFKCDGRTHCSQMTSCAEATYFLRNCPGVKMDGNNDGVPCEQQWCR
ncbi:Excalibur calcium-binding domain protein [Variovorax sp. PBL-H6]|uniref:excalibur calcium-binding domain-containing protein n=1 Tax=Variovorax sp. PBL-H6 TaxID=434009 RepID=UPI001318F336|nr:excalibur calcium-binding domain-containing protein [Variovorax sp. PBL-H6]VTU21386.1 Excalibur calcium-binding domain protein [Variovorax sp. PBL-H6]